MKMTFLSLVHVTRYLCVKLNIDLSPGAYYCLEIVKNSNSESDKSRISDVRRLERSSDLNAVLYPGLCKTLVFIHFRVTTYMYFRREDILNKCG